MKKVRFIPLLAVLALTSCGSMKAPEFDKEGDEVTFAVYQEKYQKAKIENEVYDDSGILNDRTLKINFSTSLVSSLRRNKSEIKKSERMTKSTSEEQYDYDNFVGKTVSNLSYTYKVKDEEGSESAEQNYKYETMIQFGKVNYVEYLLEANTATKEYSTINVGTSRESAFDNAVRQNFITVLEYYSLFAPSTSEDYSFYVKDDLVFTFLTATEVEEELYTTILGRQVVYAVETTRTKIKCQINLTDKKEALRISSEVTKETQYEADANGFYDGDLETEENKTYVEFTSAAKNVNLSEIDIVDYHYVS